MNRKKVMIIAHFCDYGKEQSNNRFNYIAEMMAETGCDVELITSSFSHRDKKQRCENECADTGYKTTLIYEPSYNKNVSLKRLLYSHKKMADNLKKYLETCEKPSIIYCAIPSINVSEVAAKYAVKNKIPFIIDVQDLWPEAYKLIIKNSFLYDTITRGMQKRINAVYASADAIVAVSDTYLERAVRVNKKSKNNISVYLGTDASEFDSFQWGGKVAIEKNAGEVWIAYCGTLGHSYDLDIVIQALKDIDPKLYKFIIMGSGPLEDKFKESVQNLNINAVFTGKLPYGQMCALLKMCDIAVNPIIKNAAQSIINKHADYAMAGVPVVSSQDEGEYSHLIENYQCGINCKSDSVEEVHDALMYLISSKEKRVEYGENARKMAMERFNRCTAYSTIEDAILKFMN